MADQFLTNALNEANDEIHRLKQRVSDLEKEKAQLVSSNRRLRWCVECAINETRDQAMPFWVRQHIEGVVGELPEEALYRHNARVAAEALASFARKQRVTAKTMDEIGYHDDARECSVIASEAEEEAESIRREAEGGSD